MIVNMLSEFMIVFKQKIKPILLLTILKLLSYLKFLIKQQSIDNITLILININ